MVITDQQSHAIDARIAERLKALRQEHNWSLDALANHSGVSRATLSRLEKAEVSATATVLGKLCSAYSISLSRLMYLVEENYEPFVKSTDQPIWQDKASGFSRRSISPPASSLAGEVIEGTLKPAMSIKYKAPPRPGLEHHLVMLEGNLTISIEGKSYSLTHGDCLRYQLHGESHFETGANTGAKYLLFLV